MRDRRVFFRKLIMMIFFLMFFQTLFFSCNLDENTTSKGLDEIIKELKINPDELSLVIDKSGFRLFVCSSEKKLKAYPIVLGQNPIEDKAMEGDRRTPEGNFKVHDFYPHSKWNKFIWLDYPTAESWKKFEKAKRNKLIPQNAKIGGEIGIHGTPAACDYLIDQGVNWTFGCICLKNSDLDEIYPFVRKGMSVIVNH